MSQGDVALAIKGQSAEKEDTRHRFSKGLSKVTLHLDNTHMHARTHARTHTHTHIHTRALIECQVLKSLLNCDLTQ
jgi:hypothetical protein